MRGNMGALLKQAARVQENIKRLQHELEQSRSGDDDL